MQIFSDGIQALSQNWVLVLGVTFALSLNFLFSLKTKQEISFKITLALLFFGSLLLRLAFLRDIYLPPYFDSVEHLRIINALLDGWKSLTLLDSISNVTPSYYHLGYHLLASLLNLILGAKPPNMMLVFGQVILAFIPLPIFLLIWQKTKDLPSALFAALLAGFGWYMPAFAVNWGKYPTLLSILFFEILLLNFQQDKKRNTFTKIPIFFGILITTLIHTRALILILITYISWVFAKEIKDFSTDKKNSILRILLFSIFIYFLLIQKDPLLKLALEPYLNNTSLLILFLSPFAFKKYLREIHFTLFFILFLLVTLFIPTAWILPRFPNQTLLDRPFVETILFFPLALLGGFGLAGLAGALQDLSRPYPHMQDKSRITRSTLFFIFVLLFSFFTLKNYDFYPSSCCDFVGYDDTLAFDWIDKNLPQDAQILIAGNQLNVVPNTSTSPLVASDAGIWISPLTSRKTLMLSHHLNFSSQEVFEQLCNKETDYIYLDNTSQSFIYSQLDKKPEWYKKTLALPSTSIYQLQNCSYKK